MGGLRSRLLLLASWLQPLPQLGQLGDRPGLVDRGSNRDAGRTCPRS